MVWVAAVRRVSSGFVGLMIVRGDKRQSRIPLRCIRATVHAVPVTVAGGKGIAAEAAPTAL